MSDSVCNHVCIFPQAWSSIVYSLIPNVRQLENSLSEFANIIDADEVLLFERATFLVVSHSQRKLHKDPHRFEKVSNIIKQFKLSCRYDAFEVLFCICSQPSSKRSR